jgi:hypothetical protein
MMNRVLRLSLMMVLALPVRAAEMGTTFATASEAAQALDDAARTKDHKALRALFGLATDELVAADPVQEGNDLQRFTAQYNAAHRLVNRSETEAVLEIGKDGWPFPIPLVRKDGRWFFDTNAGKEELLNRRIGRNELETLKVVRAYVEAQREYASRDHTGDDVLQYAQKFSSTPGKRDGLYWPPESDGEISPFGPLVAQAESEGYARTNNAPFHGYYFKILTRQGDHASGGKYSYVINGRMIAGFALVAWPAQYGESGIMTFIVNQQGRVYQKNLGPKTEKLAPAISQYDPDRTWQLSPD